VNADLEDVVLDSVIRQYNIRQYEYRIQAQDVLSVKVESLTKQEYDIFAYSSSQETNTAAIANDAGALFGELVDEEGNINYPVIGKIHVEGLTVFEIQDKIQEIAKEYLEDPVVKVRMLNFRFTVLGEVNREGSITTYNNRVSIMEAIGLSGGLSDLADRSSVKLVRQRGPDIEVQYINLLDENFINSPYYYIHQNDIIIVPPLKQRPFRKYFGENVSLFISSLSMLLLIVNLVNN